MELSPSSALNADPDLDSIPHSFLDAPVRIDPFPTVVHRKEMAQCRNALPAITRRADAQTARRQWTSGILFV